MGSLLYPPARKMVKLVNIFLLVTILCNSAIVSSDLVDQNPKVTLPHGGVLVGSYMKSANGSPFKVFRGVPYAQPPVGELRFKSPVPAKPWTGEKAADKDPNMCPLQNSYERNFETVGDEDCLYLNIYVAEVKTNQKPLSVMVWFHGGGWMTGNGNSALYGPQRLLDHDIILVTGNYRLGALGFLSTGTEDCPGNFGMKDQTMMLRWVKKNIEAFGGNPNDVTIFGESAGGGSVGYHIFSPLSKGLFHKAILQSGTNFNEWAFGEKEVVLERTKKVGELLGCPATDGNWKVFIECLRTKSAKDIASIVKQHFKYDIDPAVVYPIVAEPDIEGAFITKSPADIDIAPSAEVPIIIGITSEEGAMKSPSLINLMYDDFISHFDEALPVLLFYDHKPKDVQKELTKRIDEFYFKGKRNWSKADHHNLTNLFTDNWFIWGQDKFLRHRFAAAKKGKVGATYAYLFDHRGPKSMTEDFHGLEEYYGVCHTDELLYLFFYKVLDIDGGANDRKMKWAMPLMWTSFAKTGNPTPDDSEITEWVPADRFPLKYAHIGRKTKEDWTILTNEEGLYEDRVQFWRSLEKYY
ncbi:esterase FE4-like [Hermetia illucens]|nr:esterase FE4-like [Hermetia illucens]